MYGKKKSAEECEKGGPLPAGSAGTTTTLEAVPVLHATSWEMLIPQMVFLQTLHFSAPSSVLTHCCAF